MPIVENQAGITIQKHLIVSLMAGQKYSQRHKDGKLQAPRTGCHGRTVAERYSYYCRNVHVVYTQWYDFKLMFKDRDMRFWCEERSYKKLWQWGSRSHHVAYSLLIVKQGCLQTFSIPAWVIFVGSSKVAWIQQWLPDSMDVKSSFNSGSWTIMDSCDNEWCEQHKWQDP